MNIISIEILSIFFILIESFSCHWFLWALIEIVRFWVGGKAGEFNLFALLPNEKRFIFVCIWLYFVGLDFCVFFFTRCRVIVLPLHLSEFDYSTCATLVDTSLSISFARIVNTHTQTLKFIFVNIPKKFSYSTRKHFH